jgi:hypothetical protein
VHILKSLKILVWRGLDYFDINNLSSLFAISNKLHPSLIIHKGLCNIVKINIENGSFL